MLHTYLREAKQSIKWAIAGYVITQVGDALIQVCILCKILFNQTNHPSITADSDNKVWVPVEIFHSATAMTKKNPKKK